MLISEIEAGLTYLSEWKISNTEYNQSERQSLSVAVGVWHSHIAYRHTIIIIKDKASGQAMTL